MIAKIWSCIIIRNDRRKFIMCPIFTRSPCIARDTWGTIVSRYRGNVSSYTYKRIFPVVIMKGKLTVIVGANYRARIEKLAEQLKETLPEPCYHRDVPR